MTTEDAPKGLFAKMVRFVKNPATNWSDLDEPSSEKNSNLSKIQLKEMIERKRRNDFVRKREFDMLRKIRRREAEVGVGNANDIVRPSFFQSSLQSKPDDRANTLKKIDEIEAQMSMQWWKTKHGTVPGEMRSTGTAKMAQTDGSDAADSTDRATQAASDFSYAPTAPAKLDASGHVATPVPNAQSTLAVAAPRSQDGPVTPPPVLTKVLAPSNVELPTAAQRSAGQFPPSKPPGSPVAASASAPSSPPITNFSNTNLFAMEVDEVTHDPELEEAAIRFANGDDAGAEAGLLEVLSLKGSRANHLETWLTLFDLYRATGQAERYETAALDFVGRFQRSAPQFFSLPDIVGQMAGVSTGNAHADSKRVDWICPSVVGLQTVAALTAAMTRAATPWRLNWRNIKSIEPAAVEPLTRLLQTWASTQAVSLRFMGEQSLVNALQGATPSGDRSVDQALWQLRMAVMRLMHRPDEFELTALDYCVTYEVSPPSWEAPKSAYKTLDDEGGSVHHTIVGDSVQSTLAGDVGGSTAPVIAEGDNNASTVPPQQVSAVELAGSISGDASAALDKLEVRLSGADICVISCARLIRVDFSVAGEVLNWVAARQGEGRSVSFVDVHRLISAFFDVIGISDVAKVIHRRD
jgi:ABC-type transporter Mla MlaB component